MPASDREVFTYFQEDPNTTPETALLAYAAYVQAKYDWVDHQAQRGRSVTAEDIEEWTASQPETRLIEIRDTALTFFADAATTYMQPHLEAAKETAVKGSILSEGKRLNTELTAKVDTAMAALDRKVENATSFSGTWKQNMFLGVAASFAFTVLVILGGFIFDRDPSPFAWFKARAPAVAAPGTLAP
ncbi:hypothetical protein [Roseomonas mucosa]|uniref:hypothetical protein n=1 Tax=Roseomonas mucosa TaxID=207340 RepID=UPI00384EDD32